VGAHTDSPSLRLAPISNSSSQDFQQTCVCTYGGALWHTWFDRDLNIAGRIIHKSKNNNTYDSTLYHHEKPLMKIPNLAIHLTPQDDRGKFAPNTESHLKPIISSEIYQQLSDIKYDEQKGL
jgi:aspartyl aminopeptidase